MSDTGNYARAKRVRRETIYRPAESPGFVAWATTFDYGDGSIGASFKETLRLDNPLYRETRLEDGEALAVPYSYASVFCGARDVSAFWVYMRSFDNGRTFTETGRAPLGQGSDIHIGFPDGRIIGYHVPSEMGGGVAHGRCIRVMESVDGGSTWTALASLLEGNSIYLWRVRRLRDGTAILMASLYGTPWGPGQERATRNTMLPGETYISKIQTFFMASSDGVNFTGPHYILPGTGAHEFDVVELDGTTMLFIQGDVQGTPPARQKVKRESGRYINLPVHGINLGSGEGGQSGYIPESIVRLPNGLLVGSRRCQAYSCSADEGENWHKIDGLPPSLYQPFLSITPSGDLVNIGHFGGDAAFGQVDMHIGADFFQVESDLPGKGELLLERCLSADGSRFLNRYRANLSCEGRPIAGQEIVFRFEPCGDTGFPAKEATAATDKDGWAEAGLEECDCSRDIYFSYSAKASFAGSSQCSSCESPLMQVYAMRPSRKNPYPYSAYFAEGVLYLSPEFMEKWPDAAEILKPAIGRADGLAHDSIGEALLTDLMHAGVLIESDGKKRWQQSIHAPFPLAGVKPMGGGDWFV